MEGDALGGLVRSGDDKVVVHVDVTYGPYRVAKAAALGALALPACVRFCPRLVPACVPGRAQKRRAADHD
ncbi:MAG: hypothetical protein R2715_00350 [Ilumatobacteraceae bacterium]